MHGGKRLVYLDSASSSQKPQPVLDAMTALLRDDVRQRAPRRLRHRRGGDRRYEEAPGPRWPASSARRRPREIVFTKNVTEAINLVAYTWGRANLREGDAVLLTEMEHHANLVPWLMLKEERGIELRFIPMAEDDGHLDLTDLDRLVDGVKLVGVTAMSNVLGTLTPGPPLADAAHAAGALCWSTARSTCPTCPPTWPRSAATSSASPATRCSAPPASACCGPARSCSTRCRRSSAAAR